MKDTNVILYSGGAYGTFIEWCCNYFSGKFRSDTLPPFSENGSCHLNQKAPMVSVFPPSFCKYIESSNTYPFIRLHEASINEKDAYEITQGNLHNVLIDNLSYLTQHVKKVIYIYPTETSIYWINNNAYYKINFADRFGPDNESARIFFKNQNLSDQQIEIQLVNGIDRLRAEINYQTDMRDNVMRWNPSGDVQKLNLWELRELSSEYHFDRMQNGLLDKEILGDLAKNFPTVKFIPVDQLRDNFHNTIIDILEHFEIDIVNWNKIDNIYSLWLPKQLYINADKNISLIVDALINRIPLDWSTWNITFIDEFIIQRLLLDSGVEIACYNLNKFPTNTAGFLPFLIK